MLGKGGNSETLESILFVIWGENDNYNERATKAKATLFPVPPLSLTNDLALSLSKN